MTAALEVPATRLQAARLRRGWKQSQTILALRQQAHADHVPIATPASLKTMLSRWENGESAPGSVYKALFCKVYGATSDELGLEDEGRPAIGVPRVPPRVDAATVAYFKNVFVEHLRADNLMGPHHLVDVVRAQAALLDQVLPQARGSDRLDLLILACRYNEFTGWLYQDAGHPERAMHHTDRAMEYAMEIGDASEVSYVLMRKSNIACDAHSADRALGLTDAALRDQAKLSPQIRALILGQRGRALAMLGRLSECARTLDRAFRELTRPLGEPDERAAYCTLAYVDMEAATCWHQLGRYDSAIPIFERGASAMPATQRRDQGLCLARLATAHAARQDRDSACTSGWRAVEVVQTATSARSLRELQKLGTRLAPWRRDAEVSELTRHISDLLQPTGRVGATR